IARLRWRIPVDERSDYWAFFSNNGEWFFHESSGLWHVASATRVLSIGNRNSLHTARWAFSPDSEWLVVAFEIPSAVRPSGPTGEWRICWYHVRNGVEQLDKRISFGGLSYRPVYFDTNLHNDRLLLSAGSYPPNPSTFSRKLSDFQSWLPHVI